MEIWKKGEPLLPLPAWKSRTQPLNTTYIPDNPFNQMFSLQCGHNVCTFGHSYTTNNQVIRKYFLRNQIQYFLSMNLQRTLKTLGVIIGVLIPTGAQQAMAEQPSSHRVLAERSSSAHRASLLSARQALSEILQMILNHFCSAAAQPLGHYSPSTHGDQWCSILKCHCMIEKGSSIGHIFIWGTEGLYQNNFFGYIIQIYHRIFDSIFEILKIP